MIDLGHCFNLLESKSLQVLKEQYELLKRTRASAGAPMPRNLAVAGGKDLLLRKLDCAVVEMTHTYNRETGQPPYDSVRGVFVEGEKLYENSGFNAKNHIYFLPRRPLEDYRMP